MSPGLGTLPEAAPPPASEVGRWDVEPRPMAARSLRHEVIARWGASRPSGEDAGSMNRLVLVLTELVTNAVQHGELSIDVRLSRTAVGWLVVVTEVPPPVARVPEHRTGWADDERHAEGTGGRGLAIVAAVSTRCGRRMVDSGLQVWCEVPLVQRPAPPDAPA